MEQQEYAELVRRLVAVSEQHEARMTDLQRLLHKTDERQAEGQSLLASLNTKYQRMDISLTYIDEAMGKQTTILEQQQTLLTELKTIAQHHTTLLDRLTLVLERHEATFERLGRLLDERLPPPSGNGRTEG
jgi:hypothetical protein